MPNLDKNELPHWVDPSAYDRHAEDTCEGYGPAPDDPFHENDVPVTCSMCGSPTHTERERTDDGEWDEDCVFHPFVDRDGNDRRNNNPRSL